MDEASGNALDAHGSNGLTDNNTVGSATGKINNARDFEADNAEYFSRADNADLSTGDIDFTIACWINFESKGATRPIVQKASGTEVEYALWYSTADDRIRFWVSADGTDWHGTLSDSNLGSPSTATWYFVIAWHDASANTINLKINNGTTSSTSYSSGVFNGGAPFNIGFNGSGGSPAYFDGLIDEVGFWKRVLTSDEMTSLYNSGNGLAYPFSTFDAATFPWAATFNRPPRRTEVISY